MDSSMSTVSFLLRPSQYRLNPAAGLISVPKDGPASLVRSHPSGAFAGLRCKPLKRLVPDEGIEPPTFGLQNRCSTAELIRPAGAGDTSRGASAQEAGSIGRLSSPT